MNPIFAQSEVGELLLLHAGCGSRRNQDLLGGFKTVAWREIRDDINLAAKPDIQGSITDMSAVATASVDALYDSHVIELLYAHEVPMALTRPEG